MIITPDILLLANVYHLPGFLNDAQVYLTVFQVFGKS